MTSSAPICCGAAARLTDGSEIYPHRPDLHSKRIWMCDACSGYVGCHPGTTTPLGSPAGPALRDARIKLHHRMIDPLWKTADNYYKPTSNKERNTIRRCARTRVYAYLANRMGISASDCHTGMFSIDQCRAAWAALKGITYEDIRSLASKPIPSSC
ncbi:MAG: DUF3268 family zinc-finger domain-containing protein [Rhodopseudomonas palustris]|nr:DUF3268 family zinc-finger domain-containing protein [Rhodopseudomonas palustris]